METTSSDFTSSAPLTVVTSVPTAAAVEPVSSLPALSSALSSSLLTVVAPSTCAFMSDSTEDKKPSMLTPPTSDAYSHMGTYTNQHTPSRSSVARLQKPRGKPPGKPRVYQRYPKPPYSYVGMIIVAIETSPDKNLTLSELNDRLMSMFEFFRGKYQGWRDSVRHTLSSSPCFVRTEARREGTYVWLADVTKAPANVFKRQETRVTEGNDWAPTLHEQLNIPEIVLPTKQHPAKRRSPDLSFSIDNVLTDIDPANQDPPHDYRSFSSPAYDSPVFTTKSIHLRRKHSSTHSQLSKLIAEQSVAWGVSQEKAIENLSFLCKSMPLPVTTNNIAPTSQQDVPTQDYSHAYSPAMSSVYSPDVTYSPSSLSQPYSPVQQPYSPVQQPYSPVTATTVSSYSYFPDQSHYTSPYHYAPEYYPYYYPGYQQYTDYQWCQSPVAMDMTSAQPLDLSVDTSSSSLSLSSTEL